MGDNILFLFPIIFIATWVFVIFLMSIIGGWFNLSKKYPYKNKKDISEKLYKRQSVTLNFIGRYRYCINVTIFYDGFLLRPTLFYSFFHKSIFIEYKQIQKNQLEKFLFIDFLTINLDGKKIKISGDSIKELKSKLGR